ncbi:TSC-22 / Dip / Bun containing protein [Cricetulus griseus]|nr:TSC-22 / Dip / Bun containing protein [Cricetulus griseus]
MNTEMYQTPMEVAVYQLHNFSISFFSSLLGGDVVSVKLDNSASGASVVALDNKIEQAMDLVKNHLMYAVREEVEILKEQIRELVEKNSQLERENTLLKTLASPEQLEKFQSRLSPEEPAPEAPETPEAPGGSAVLVLPPKNTSAKVRRAQRSSSLGGWLAVQTLALLYPQQPILPATSLLRRSFVPCNALRHTHLTLHCIHIGVLTSLRLRRHSPETSVKEVHNLMRGKTNYRASCIY